MDENKDIPIRCKRCNKKTPIKSMRYDVDGKNLICMECYNLQNTKPASSIKIEAKPKQSSFEQKIQYQCERCKYKFTRKKDWIDKRCPYCGNLDIREIQGAHTILKECTDKKYDW
ncbi:MAG: hypothetical protein QXG00_03320 [Candidatus Woesearchaeota archaeon]